MGDVVWNTKWDKLGVICAELELFCVHLVVDWEKGWFPAY
jgi:hypothetical protein